MEWYNELLWARVVLVILLGALTYLFLKYTNSKQNCWKNLAIPYVPPAPLFGSTLENLKKPLHETELCRYMKYGPIYGYFEGSTPMLSVADPKHLRNIMVKDFQFFTDRRTLKTGDTVTESMLQLLEGEDWKRVRSIVTPTFTTGKIKRMMGIFSGCAKVLVENFRTFAKKEEPVEVKRIYGAFSMDVIASAAFSTKIDSHNDPNNEFVQHARKVFNNGINYRFVLYLLFPRILRFFKVTIFPSVGVKFFTKVTLQIIAERKRTGQTRNDFLQLLIDSANEQQEEEKAEKTDDILSNYEAEQNDQVFKNYKPTKKALSSNELVAQCVIFFLAGFETTASTLSFATYFLALNPDVQNKLVQELKETIEACNGKLTYEAIQNMKYLDNVISETMRLNPPSIRLERIANADYPLGDTAIVIPKETVVTIPIYAFQRDAKYYPNPEVFDPDRFTPEMRAKRDPYTFMPFGTGPRNCVGMRFALVEVKVCLAYIVCHFRLKRCSQTKVPLEFEIGQGLLQPKGITVLMEDREDNPLKQ